MLEPIQSRHFVEPDRTDVQSRAIAAASLDPERFLSAYVSHPESFGGRYVCADLMKETFADYAASPQARGRYNAAVHNTAAVLSAEQFRRALTIDRAAERDTAVFLTGMPGAGKTSRVLQAGALAPTFQLVYEGQLNSPAASHSKIGAALEVGLRPLVTAVLPRPETALENTFKRFAEVGRGASVAVMTTIQEGLADALTRLDREYGSRIDIRVFDVRDQARPLVYEGKRGISVVEQELSNGSVENRLLAALEKHRDGGRISEDCYRQALGEAPRAGYRGLAQALPGGGRGAGDGREGSQERSGAPVLNASRTGAPAPSGLDGPQPLDRGERADRFLALSRAQALATGDSELGAAWKALDLVRAKLTKAAPEDPAHVERLVSRAQGQIADRIRDGLPLVPERTREDTSSDRGR